MVQHHSCTVGASKNEGAKAACVLLIVAILRDAICGLSGWHTPHVLQMQLQISVNVHFQASMAGNQLDIDAVLKLRGRFLSQHV
jgi:hypothetical protein